MTKPSPLFPISAREMRLSRYPATSSHHVHRNCCPSPSHPLPLGYPPHPRPAPVRDELRRSCRHGGQHAISNNPKHHRLGRKLDTNSSYRTELQDSRLSSHSPGSSNQSRKARTKNTNNKGRWNGVPPSPIHLRHSSHRSRSGTGSPIITSTRTHQSHSAAPNVSDSATIRQTAPGREFTEYAASTTKRKSYIAAPNYAATHHAWSRACPVRLVEVSRGREQ